MFEKRLLAHFTRLARLIHALFLYKICIGSLRRWWGLGLRIQVLGWPKTAGSPRKQALIVSMNVAKLTTILVKFGLSCYKTNWFLCRNEVDIKRFVYNRHGGWHQICYVQDHYVNLFVIQVEIAQLFMCIATFIYKHEILLRQKVAETSFCNSVGVKTTAMA